MRKILKHIGLSEVKARPPPRANASPPDVHIDYSARPGATSLPVAAQTMHYFKRDFFVYSAGDRSGPGILRYLPVRIISFTIPSIQLRLMPHDFFKNWPWEL